MSCRACEGVFFPLENLNPGTEHCDRSRIQTTLTTRLRIKCSSQEWNDASAYAAFSPSSTISAKLCGNVGKMNGRKKSAVSSSSRDPPAIGLRLLDRVLSPERLVEPGNDFLSVFLRAG